MLDLQPRVGLDEVETRLCAGLRVDQELERAEALVTDLRRHAHRRADQAPADPVADRGARRDLDELLVAALQRALALPDVSHLARAVSDDLHFDVPRARQVLLDVEIPVAERRGRFRATARIRVVELLGARDDPHAAAASARDRLQHDRAARPEGREKFAGLGGAGRARSAVQDRHAATLGERTSAALVAEQLEHIGSRTDERDPRLRAAPRESGVLGEKPVARVERIAAGLARHRHQLLRVQVRRRACATQPARLVGLGDVKAAPVVLGEHRHAAHADFGRGTQDADRDLSSIRYQESVHVTRLRAGDREPLRASSSARRPPAYPADRRSESRRSSSARAV